MDWLIDWLIDSFIDWLMDRLIDRLIWLMQEIKFHDIRVANSVTVRHATITVRIRSLVILVVYCMDHVCPSTRGEPSVEMENPL